MSAGRRARGGVSGEAAVAAPGAALRTIPPRGRGVCLPRRMRGGVWQAMDGLAGLRGRWHRTGRQRRICSESGSGV